MVVEPLRRIEADLVFAGVRKIDWLNEPFVCRMPTCALGRVGIASGEATAVTGNPGFARKRPDGPGRVVLERPAPREGVFEAGSPKVGVPPMPKGELKTEAEGTSKSAVAVMFAPLVIAVESVKLNLALPLPSVVTVVCPMNVRPW